MMLSTLSRLVFRLRWGVPQCTTIIIIDDDDKGLEEPAEPGRD